MSTKNEKLRKNVETEVSNTKSLQELEADRWQLKYKAMKESGMSEQYFIERKRSKSITEIFKTGLSGNNKALILPYESLIGGNNQLLLTKTLYPDSTLTSMTLQK